MFQMKKIQIVDRAKAIIRETYRELNELAKQIEEEQEADDNMMEKINQIAEDVTKMRTGLIG